MGNYIDITGEKFGRLTVIKRISPKGAKHIKYLCQCDCGNICEVTKDCLLYGNTKSCGCYRKETTSQISKKNSRTIVYCEVEDYIMGEDGAGHQFKISKESYEEVSKYHWTFAEGYWIRTINKGNGKFVMQRLHRFLNPDVPTSILIDHRNRDRSDNRLSNLRVADYSLNGANTKISTNNTSGFKGVHFHKKSKKWCATIMVKGKNIWLGESDDKETAIKRRLTAEKLYFGEFAPQRDKFQQYNI